jgi:hypothetical protein
MSLLDIYKKSNFGVEIEGCSNYLSQIESCDSIYTGTSIHDKINKLICYANKYVKSSCIPLITNNNNPINQLLFYNPITTDPFETGHGWCYMIDQTIKCNESENVSELPATIETIPVEIVTPILSMDDASYFQRSIHQKNNIWGTLERHFTSDNCYFEGIFILVMWFLFIFDNKYCKIGRMFDAIENSTGLHVHYSNSLLTKSSEGVLILAYVLKYFIFFEKTIFSFLHKSRENNDQVKSMIPRDKDLLLIFKFWNNIFFLIREQIIDNIEKFHDLIKDMTKACKDRKHTLNLTINFLSLDDGNKYDIIEEGQPMRFEFRLYHGTKNIKEIHNWTHFVCLFMSSCIKKGHEGKFDLDLMEIKNNPQSEQIFFDLLFDEFVPDENLKIYYYHKLKNRYPESTIIFNRIQEDKRIKVVCEKYFGGPEEEINIDDELMGLLRNVETCYSRQESQDGGKNKYLKYYKKNKFH